MSILTRGMTTAINCGAVTWFAYMFSQVMLFGRFVVFEQNPAILAFEFFMVVMAIPLNLLHFWQDVPAPKRPRPLTKKQKLSLGVRL